VPEAVDFATKPALALRMLARAFAAAVPAAWVTGDEIYGTDPDLRRWLERADHPYVLAVSCSHPVWHEGQQEWADALVAALSAEAWGTLSCGTRSQGARLGDWACLHLPYASAPGMAQWLLIRRNVSEPTERAYFRAFGPAQTSLPELVRVAGMRWTIEESFADVKGVVGLDQYEVRKWTSWYRHITLALLAHAYLEVTRREGEKGDQAICCPRRCRKCAGCSAPSPSRRNASPFGLPGRPSVIRPLPNSAMPPDRREDSTAPAAARRSRCSAPPTSS
jgi:SRSO17 transposase